MAHEALLCAVNFDDMKNRILITIALWLLSKVDKEKIEYKNSWDHYKREIESFIN